MTYSYLSVFCWTITITLFFPISSLLMCFWKLLLDHSAVFTEEFLPSMVRQKCIPYG